LIVKNILKNRLPTGAYKCLVENSNPNIKREIIYGIKYPILLAIACINSIQS